MATITLGTASTTTLTALVFSPAAAPTDIATIAALILDDTQVVAGASGSGPAHIFSAVGANMLLNVPNRGQLILRPGDVVAVDSATGWPILLSAVAASGTSYIHT